MPDHSIDHESAALGNPLGDSEIDSLAEMTLAAVAVGMQVPTASCRILATVLTLRAELAAANERADLAERRASTWKRQANEKLEERDEARARLAELRLLRLEWSTANCYSDLGDDIVSEQLARRRVAAHPEIHAAVVSRQIYAGPWREGACRSCGTDERVVGDPPLCSSCAVYGAGLAKLADAAQDGRSATETLRDPFGVAFHGNTSSILPQGLSGEEE